jgi:4'-phosphopantetheinyl transferase
MPAGSAFRVEIVEGLGGASPAGRLPAEDAVILGIARPADMADPAGLLVLLSDDEKGRLTRLRFEPDRAMYLVAHGLLRLTLSRCSGVAPEAWQFRRGSHGRPEIAHPASRLRFSLSHTRGLAACAVVLDREVGVDVEDLSRDPATGVAERFFSPLEADDVLNAPAGTRGIRFLEYWTLKEAYAKARGLGLSLPLNRFSVYNTTGNTWAISFEPPLNDDPARWWLRSFRIGETHQAALAIG